MKQRTYILMSNKMKNLLSLKVSIFILSYFLLPSAFSAEIIGLGGKCLNVDHGQVSTILNACYWYAQGNQEWEFVNGEIRSIGVRGRTRCLDVSGRNYSNGAKVILYNCHGGANQKWQVVNGSIRGLGGKCLDVSGENAVDGTPIIMYKCTGRKNQQWRIR